jgi:hypothetical protein
VLATALLTLSVLAGSALGRTWYIKPDGSGDAPTIQAGVDAASDGDVVLVAAGTYSATSTIDIAGTPTVVCVAIGKNVNLLSESGPQSTTIENATAKIAVYIHDVGSSVEINGFRIRTEFNIYYCVDSPGEMAPLPFLKRGITCRNASPLITNNEISENGAAIELLNSPASVTGNTVVFASNGVSCLDGSDAVVSRNVIHTCGVGVEVQASSPTITDNELYDGCAGIECGNGGMAVIENNTIHDFSPVGVQCGGASIRLANNRISHTNAAVILNVIIGTAQVVGNVLVDQYSAALSLSDNPQAAITIEENTIDGTGLNAIFCQAGSSPIIRRNIIVGSTFGIRCVLSSFPLIECNDVVTTQGRYVGDCTDQTDMNGNISVDPQFCGLAGANNYGLQSDSPCAPGNHPDGYSCGRIGARDVACDPVATKSTTWGAVKAMYRR